jgi:hypothetical protein
MVETQNTAVEALLERHLGAVQAPGELWARIQNPARNVSATRRQTVARKLAWALLAVVVFAGTVSSFREPKSFAVNEAAALQALARGTDDLEFKSAKAMEIRTWVRTRTGIELPLPQDSPVQLLGARVAAADTVEVAYRVGDRPATLVVSKTSAAFFERDRHRKLNREALQVARTYSWAEGSQLFTLACAVPGGLEAACSLCHVDAKQL